MGTQTTTTHICDKCSRSFPDNEQFRSARCPSEAPMMEVTIGHHTEPTTKEHTSWYSRVGASLGELCKFCQEDLNNYLKTNYPKYREVSFND